MLKEPIIKKDKPTTSDEGGERSKWFAIGYDDHKLYYVGTWDCSDEAYKSMKRLYPHVRCMYVANDEMIKFWFFQFGMVLDGAGLYSVPKEEAPDEVDIRKKDYSTIDQKKMMKWFAFTSDANLYYVGVHDDLWDVWETADEVNDYDVNYWQNRGMYSEAELLQWRPLINTILGVKGFYQAPTGRSHEKK